MDITPAQRKFLSEAANNWLGVAKLYDLHGLARRSRRQMAETLCGYGLMEIYTYGRNEYRITQKGRAALSAPSASVLRRCALNRRPDPRPSFGEQDMSELTKLENDVLDAVTAYLVARGWKVAVIGGMQITRPDPLRAHHYDFAVGFTGRMPAEWEARTTLEASEQGGGE